MTSGAFYSMGIALPMAIGASATEKDAQVIAITGDGSIELNIQELRTLSQNKLDVKLFIIIMVDMHLFVNHKMSSLVVEDIPMMKKYLTLQILLKLSNSSLIF